VPWVIWSLANPGTVSVADVNTGGDSFHTINITTGNPMSTSCPGSAGNSTPNLGTLAAFTQMRYKPSDMYTLDKYTGSSRGCTCTIDANIHNNALPNCMASDGAITTLSSFMR
jgi:hypothetical protein